MEVTYLDHMGSDLMVVNAARVSFAKRSEFETGVQQLEGWVCQDTGTVRAYCEKQANGRVDQYQEASDQPPQAPGCDCMWQDAVLVRKLKEKDARLIAFLRKHRHMLPFRHPHVSFHFKAPIFVARQLVKHQVGMSWSEISRRYVRTEPEFYWPEEWRQSSSDIKQGSLNQSVPEEVAQVMDLWKRGTEVHAKNGYAVAVNHGVAPEQARMFLPLNTYTEWHWTGSLLAWSHVWNERTAPDAQAETRECIKLIGPTMERLFPVSWKVLTE